MSGFAPDAVTATLTRPLRGTDVVETFTVLRGELGDPHRAAVPVLPERGPHAELAALHLADADADAFGALSAAYALPKDSDQEQSERSGAIQEATVGAARPPRDLVDVGAEVLELTRELETWVNPNVLSDVAAAAEAIRAAIATAMATIETNLASLKDPATREELSADVERAEELANGAAQLARRIRERIRG